MAVYDPQMVAEYAANLHEKADWAKLRYALIYAFFGAALSLLVLPAFGQILMEQGDGYIRPWASGARWVVAGCAIAGFILGWDAGAARGWSLRMEAQNVLCQVEIERNTAGAPAVEDSTVEDASAERKASS